MLLQYETSSREGIPWLWTKAPVSQVTAFRYESMEELERVFAHKSMGYAYTRIGNPTLAAFEQKIIEMEGGAGAICTSSGCF